MRSNAGAASGSQYGAVHDRVIGLTRLSGWRAYLLALIAGALSVLAMAPFFLWPVLFVTFPVFIWLLDGANKAASDSTISWRLSSWRASAAFRAGITGWWFSFGYFFAGLFWIGEAFLVEADKFAWALPFAVILMPAGLALFWASAAAVASAAWRPGFTRVLGMAVSLSAFEWLRGHIFTGFPWNLPGYALTYPLALMQSAAVIGVYGLTLVALLLFTAPAVIWFDAQEGCKKQAGAIAATTAVVPLLAMLLYGWLQLSQSVPPPVAGVTLRIVQPSIPQDEKWLPQHQLAIFKKHLALSGGNAASKKDDLKNISLVIWPEAAMPFLPLREPGALSRIASLLPKGAYLLSGALRSEPPSVQLPRRKRRTFNTVLVLDDNANLVARYDKTHLVPFGEYLPFQETLESIGLEQLTRFRGGFASGALPRQLISIPGLPKIGALICYEAIFPGVGAKAAARPGVLINLTNDGWFGDTTGPRQHFHQARVRAVEEAIPLIRAANNGISAVIDPKGRIMHRLGMNKIGVIDSRLPAALPATLYSTYGDGIFWLLWLTCITLLVSRLYRFGL